MLNEYEYAAYCGDCRDIKVTHDMFDDVELTRETFVEFFNKFRGYDYVFYYTRENEDCIEVDGEDYFLCSYYPETGDIMTQYGRKNTYHKGIKTFADLKKLLPCINGMIDFIIKANEEAIDMYGEITPEFIESYNEVTHSAEFENDSKKALFVAGFDKMEERKAVIAERNAIIVEQNSNDEFFEIMEKLNG